MSGISFGRGFIFFRGGGICYLDVLGGFFLIRWRCFFSLDGYAVRKVC